jgi:hypothetical protein
MWVAPHVAIIKAFGQYSGLALQSYIIIAQKGSAEHHYICIRTIARNHASGIEQFHGTDLFIVFRVGLLFGSQYLGSKGHQLLDGVKRVLSWLLDRGVVWLSAPETCSKQQVLFLSTGRQAKNVASFQRPRRA